MRLRLAALLLAFAPIAVTPIAAASAQTAPAPGETYIHAGRVLADPATGKVLTEKTIVVSGGRVVAIRDGYQGNGDVVDLRDAFVLPGLIDSHVHILGESGAPEIDAFKKTSADMLVDGMVFARRTVEAGFTTVADLGGDPDAMFALRDGIAAGKIDGPRIIVAGFVGAHGGHGDTHGYRADILKMFQHPGLCSGADDCVRAVRQAVQRGAEVIKTASTGGVMSNTAAGLSQQLSDEELSAIVTTAHRLGRRVVSHAHAADGINAALRAGVDSIEHGTYLDATSIRLAKASGAYLVPTLLAGDTVMRDAQDPKSWMPPAVRAKALQVGPNMIAGTRRAHEGGMKIAFGTDSGVSKHGINAREFALMTKAGLTPLDAIRAATVWGAAHNRLSDQIGSIEAGKAADIIAVRGDPLKDVTELERVRFVMKGGKVVKAEAAGQ